MLLSKLALPSVPLVGLAEELSVEPEVEAGAPAQAVRVNRVAASAATMASFFTRRLYDLLIMIVNKTVHNESFKTHIKLLTAKCDQGYFAIISAKYDAVLVL